MKNDKSVKQSASRKTLSYSLILLMTILPAVAIQAKQERYIAIDNKGLWPNLTLLPNGDIVAAVFNQPNHGKTEGDVELWSSTDGGKLWALRGTPTTHDPETNRMNVATGVAHNGDFIVLSGGLGGEDYRGFKLPIQVTRSNDGGRNWQRSLKLELPTDIGYLVPYGDLVQLEGRRLAAAFYGKSSDAKTRFPTEIYVLFSQDDGLSWGDGKRIGTGDYNETTLLRLRSGRLLAAARTSPGEHGGRVDLYASVDEGKTWVSGGPLTLPQHHPADLIQLRDGHILLTYGIREKGHYGIGMRLSSDEGKTWSAPNTIVDLPGTTDGGYPSTVELEDGSLVTAYYSDGIAQHRRYHMGVTHWTLSDFLIPRSD